MKKNVKLLWRSLQEGEERLEGVSGQGGQGGQGELEGQGGLGGLEGQGREERGCGRGVRGGRGVWRKLGGAGMRRVLSRAGMWSELSGAGMRRVLGGAGMAGMGRMLGVLGVLVCVAAGAQGQKVGVKTNVLYDATTSMNLGFEFGLAPRWTLDVAGVYNPFTLDKEKNRKAKSWGVFPEARYWFCNRFQGHFLGLHTGYSEYNMGGVRIPFRPKSMKRHRFQGWGTGVGLGYGHAWILGKRWNLEAEIGVGYVFTRYDKYDCVTCGDFKGREKEHYFGPTKAAVSVVFMIN